MGEAQSAFKELLYGELIPAFCGDERRNLQSSGFRSASLRIDESDALDFLRAWDAALIQHEGHGLYRMPKSAAVEQFFWEGRKSLSPRPFTLWLEPIITIAGLARLHFDWGWPAHLIGMQSVDWAFDLVAFAPTSSNEHIAGEVKKSVAEVETLISLMREYGSTPPTKMPKAGKARNAYKKLIALQSRHPPIFWVLGPNGTSKVFRVKYKREAVMLNEVAEDVLRCPF